MMCTTKIKLRIRKVKQAFNVINTVLNKKCNGYITRVGICFYLILIFNISSLRIEATENYIPEEPIKVGFYQTDPYYFLDENGKPSGYYSELMELMAKTLNIDYEYVYVSMDEALNKLNNHEVDLLFGVGRTDERESQYVYSKYYIAQDLYIASEKLT